LGYEPAYGARPLKRALREQVLEPLSERIIAGEVDASEPVVIDLNKDANRVEFKKGFWSNYLRR
jgi:ATP-dependent Clp protease ATP-binding subunit ClpB